MNLNATISASPYDAFYDMASVYCFDSVQNYCFSLTRAPSSSEIEIMVVDQINRKTEELTVQLNRNNIKVTINPALAKQLDRHEKYTVEFVATEQEFKNIQHSLEKIFEGKSGLSVNAV